MKRNTGSAGRAPQVKRDERGAAMVVSVIGMLALILATGLAVDISHFYTAKAELQTAAGAAARAAARRRHLLEDGARRHEGRGRYRDGRHVRRPHDEQVLHGLHLRRDGGQ